ncbi:unnamed protein product [Vicia faba]|uniref:Uncharacterized protein n=1 Tax=Vicia faba TaxID=3906 RepID=A0AAV0YNK6_VICFA|nr:unnamed protein product [Vicia faba]
MAPRFFFRSNSNFFVNNRLSSPQINSVLSPSVLIPLLSPDSSLLRFTSSASVTILSQITSPTPCFNESAISPSSPSLSSAIHLSSCRRIKTKEGQRKLSL